MNAARDQAAIVGIGRTPFAKHLARWFAREVRRWVRGKSALIPDPRHFLGSPWHP
jgi:hypothetical protein